MTNFEKIKEMDIEELAVFIASIRGDISRLDACCVSYFGADVNDALDYLEEDAYYDR